MDKAYTKDGPIWMPDNKVTEIDPAHTYHPLRGYASCMAVTIDGKCIGYIDPRTLGFETVKDWMYSKGMV